MPEDTTPTTENVTPTPATKKKLLKKRKKVSQAQMQAMMQVLATMFAGKGKIKVMKPKLKKKAVTPTTTEVAEDGNNQ